MLLDVAYDYPDCVAVPVFLIYAARHSKLCESSLYPRNQRYRNQERKESEKQKWKGQGGEGREENAVKSSVFNFRRKKENLEAAD